MIQKKYDVTRTKGYALLKGLGTFMGKYYPYKKNVAAILSAYEEFAGQYEQTLEEINKKYTNSTCPTYHVEKLHRIELKELVPLFVSSKNSPLIAGVPCLMFGVDTPTAGVSNLYCYKIDPNIAEIASVKIANKEVAYKLEPGRILLDAAPEENYAWCTDVKFKADYVYNSLAFLFFDDANSTDIVKKLSILLLYMYRYGLIENKLRQFFNIFFNYPVILEDNEKVIEILPDSITTDRYTYTIDLDSEVLVKVGNEYTHNSPITNAVKIGDAKLADFYVMDQEVVTHEYSLSTFTYNNFRWNDGGKWNNPNPYVVDEFLRTLTDKIVYYVRVKHKIGGPSNDTYLSFKYLSMIQDIVPVWMVLNILIEYVIPAESYSVDSEEVTVKKGKYIAEEYKSYTDGRDTTARWGYVYWNSFYWNQIITQPYVEVVKQYKD